MEVRSTILHLSILIFLTLDLGLCLQWVRFKIPEWVNIGEDALLICEFDLQGDPLYSVKWYKGGREIYRYVPADIPPQESFVMPGVNIDESKSDEHHLTLTNVNFNTTGRYKCEVLTDGPFFKTLVKSSVLDVVQLPQGSPILNGAKDQYRPGDLVNITCSTSPSVPPASITWFINEKEANPTEVVPTPFYSAYSYSGLSRPMPSSLRLEMIARPEHFRRGVVTFLCRARILSLHDSRVLHTARETSSLMISFLDSHSTALIASRYLTTICILMFKILL